MKEISNRTGWSYSRVKYWMDKYNISRRSQSEATYVKRNPDGDPFKIKNTLTPKEKELRGLGLGLYWGEGDKTESTSIRLGNTDPVLIKKFRDFLIKICGVNKRKIKYSLQVFNDGSVKKSIAFWSKKLCIDKDCFGKITRLPSLGKGTYRNKNMTGVLTIYFHNKKLKEIIIKMLG